MSNGAERRCFIMKKIKLLVCSVLILMGLNIILAVGGIDDTGTVLLSSQDRGAVRLCFSMLKSD